MSTTSADQLPDMTVTHDPSARPHIAIQTSLRENSALVAAFPWLTRLPLTEGPLSDMFQDPRRQLLLPLAKKVDQYFHTMYNLHDLSSTELKSLLNPDIDRTAPFSTNTIIKLTPLLIALRVLDACMDSYPDEESAVVLKHSKTLMTKKPKLWQKFSQWPKTLIQAKETLFALSTLKDPSVEGWTQMGNFQTLMMFCVQVDAADQGIVFLRNVVIAAMDMAVMSESKDENGNGSSPYIPDTATDFAKAFTEYASRTEEFQGEHYKAISASALLSREGKHIKETRFMSNPLVFATTFSPIVLFLPHQLVTYHLAKSDVAMWTKRIGNCKPPVLQNTEREIWKALFEIASGKKAPLHALLECFERIDWDAVRSADCPNWFTEGFDDKNTVVLENVIDFDLASEVPDDWTSAQSFLDAVAKRSATSMAKENHETEVDRDENGNTSDSETMAGGNQPQNTDAEAIVSEQDATTQKQDDITLCPTYPPVPYPPASKERVNQNPPLSTYPIIVDPVEVDAHCQSGKPQESDGNINTFNVFPQRLLSTQAVSQQGHDSGDKSYSTQSSVSLGDTQSTTIGKRKNRQDINNTARGHDTKSTRSVTVNRISVHSRDIPAPLEVVESQDTRKKIEYIDIDIIMSGRPDINTDISQRATKTKNPHRPSFTVYTPRGKSKIVTPELHDQYQLDEIFAMFDASTTSYVDGKPSFLTSPANSTFAIMTEKSSKEKDQKELLNMLGPKILVLTKSAVELTSFDETGLSDLKDLGAVLSVHDYSVPPKNGSFVGRSKYTTLENILKCARDPQGKILNALDIPMGWKGAAPTPFSSETRAWIATEGLPYCKDDILPANALRWALVTTKGAHHPWHIDANGSGAFLVGGCGGKLIFVGTPITKQRFHHIDLFLNNFEPYGPCMDRWKVEAIYLEPGDKIFLPPNLPHSVFTAENTICHGGHFYASTTMMESLVGIIHNFFCNGISTNTDHAEWRDLIHRMTIFYHDIIVSRSPIRDQRTQLHAPALTNLKSLLNLFSTCAASIFMNALSAETYDHTEEAGVDEGFLSSSHRKMYDLNAMSGFTRAKCIHHRALAWEIIHHVDARYTFKDPATDEALSCFDDIFVPFISNLARAMIVYDKKIGSLKFKPSVVILPAGAMESQVKACFHTHPIILQTIDKGDDPISLIFPFKFDCVISPATNFDNIPVVVKTRGETSLDILYETGRESSWRLWAEPNYSEQDWSMDTDEDDEEDDEDDGDEYQPVAKRARKR